jgi:hypothetical protein
LLDWRGPYQVVERENKVIYVIADLVTKETFRAHVNRLHIFYPGDLSPEQLMAESARDEEYYIETVYGHRRKGGELWFYVKWLGYPHMPESDPEAWVRLVDCRSAPAVREYRRAHGL